MQHPEVGVNGSNGPFMSIDTKGGLRTFAASAKFLIFTCHEERPGAVLFHFITAPDLDFMTIFHTYTENTPLK
ncbi:MAG: hypothetical protein ACJAXK_002237 [Yoonia sp.]